MIYLEYLLYLHINEKQEFYTKNISAFKCESKLRFCNRALIKGLPTKDEFEKLKYFMDNLPYTLWIKNNLDEEIKSKLKNLHYEYLISYPVMTADINNIENYKKNNNIQIKEIKKEEEILTIWCEIIARSYKLDLEEFKIFISYLLNTKSVNIKYYLGYYDGMPAATSMVIIHDDIIGLHWVGTLPEFRNKGLGYAISCYPLNVLKDSKIKLAQLFASSMGKPIYEKIGFKESYVCDIYKNN